MKHIIKKIIREEIDDFDWIRDNSISGKELRDLILQTGVTSIPFDKVGGYLDLEGTPIKSLGNLQSVGSYLDLRETSLAKKYSEAEIRQMVQVDGNIYMQ